jgi:hypothetical protein
MVVAALSTVAATQSGYSSRAAAADHLVEGVMQLEVRLPGLSSLEHQGRLLGDSVAAAIGPTVRLRDMLDSDKANRVLDLLNFAFAEPDAIQSPEDKKPGVTLILLDYLASFSPDGLVRERASKLIVTISGAK